MLTFISGGTGTPKLLQGFMRLVPQEELSVIVNTGEDVEVSGLRVSPDVDTVVYTLAGLIDDEEWHGIEDDSFTVHDTLEELGREEILKIGDKDRAVQLYRTLRMDEGATLSEVTSEICDGLGVGAEVLPMSDERVETRVETPEGEMHFQEFWVAREGEPEVVDVDFLGAEEAGPAPGVIEAIEGSELVVIGPSNPITSLGPVLAVDEIREALERNREKVLAVSPIVGGRAVSGPAEELMNGLGHEVSSVSVARIYQDFVGTFFVHEPDAVMKDEIEKLGLKARVADVMMPGIESRTGLAQRLLEEK